MTAAMGFSTPAHEEKTGFLDDRASSDSESDGGTLGGKRQFGVKVNFPTYSQYSSAIAIPWNQVRSTHWRVLFLRVAIFLTPSFLQGRQAREQICPPKLAPTAYLDGMRGLAALVVFFCHYSYQAFTIAEGWGTGENNYHILKLPLLRLWYQGPPAVCVFFIISGYALSYRPLKLLRGGSFSDFATTMSSLTFRRALRLYLPTITSTFMIICLLRVGAYEWVRDFAHDRKYMKMVVEPHPGRMDSAYDQYRDWALHMYRFIHIWDWNRFGGSTTYDVHLWTIPVEYRCSLYLFVVIIGTARLRTGIRFLTVGAIMVFTYRHSRWEFLLFLCGMVLAELDHIRGAHVPSSTLPVDEKQPAQSRSRLRRMFWALVSVLGLYLMCQPDFESHKAPGWVYLSSLIPKWWDDEQYRYWQSAGAVVFVWAVGHSRGWQRFFNTPAVQYLGKISYALYLMHGPAMHTVGYQWERMAYGITGVEGYWYNAGFALGAVFCIPTVIWWADIFWRAVDIPTVKFAKWVEAKCIVKK